MGLRGVAATVAAVVRETQRLSAPGGGGGGMVSRTVHGETLQTPTLFPMPWGHLDTLRPPPEKALPEPVDLDTFARPDWL